MRAVNLPPLGSSEPIELVAYRNIYTVTPSQDLFDDLVADRSNDKVLQAWENETSRIDHAAPQKERVFQYGNTLQTSDVFEKEKWRLGRFGDGTNYGVWYGALEEKTSILEALYWAYRFCGQTVRLTQEFNRVDRRMFRADCQTADHLDLRPFKESHPLLVHPTDYSLCSALGDFAQEKKLGLYLTPSVRNPKGTCVPVFRPDVLKQDRTIYFLHFDFYPDGRIEIIRDQTEAFTIPKTWKD